jgi:hypothetical protein
MACFGYVATAATVAGALSVLGAPASARQPLGEGLSANGTGRWRRASGYGGQRWPDSRGVKTEPWPSQRTGCCATTDATRPSVGRPLLRAAVFGTTAAGETRAVAL